MKKYVIFGIIIFLLSLFSVSQASAMIITGQDSVTVGKDEVIDDDLFTAGQDVTVEGVINGDLYAAGGSVKISGEVNGDVLAAGGSIEVTGSVGDDVRVAGGNIVIKGAKVGDSLTSFGGNVVIDEGTQIGGGLVFGAGNISSDASVGRGITGGGGSVKINGQTAKDVYIGSDKLTFGPKADIAGNLVYQSQSDAIISDEATVAGEVTKILPSAPDTSIRMKFNAPEGLSFLGKSMKWGYRIWSYLSALLVGLVVIYLMPKIGKSVVDSLEKNFLASLGWGLLSIILIGPVLILIMITGIGVPLALIIGACFAISLYLSKLAVGLAVGGWIEKQSGKKLNMYLSFVLGLALFYVLKSLPFVGFLFSLVGTLSGLGAIMLYKKEKLFRKK